MAKAMQVTEENLRTVANWCHGEIGMSDGTGVVKKFIWVDDKKWGGHFSRAGIGDWVVLDDFGLVFTGYTNKQYMEMLKSQRLFEVLRLVELAMAEQDNETYRKESKTIPGIVQDMKTVAEGTARKIMALFETNELPAIDPLTL